MNELEFWQNHLARLYIKLASNIKCEETRKRIENAEFELHLLTRTFIPMTL